VKFVDCREGDYVIHAGACEAAAGGFHASVVITRPIGARQALEAYRLEMLDDRRAWNRADIALDHAIGHARAILANARHLLRC
jgi:hypothetical protein